MEYEILWQIKGLSDPSAHHPDEKKPCYISELIFLG